MHKLFALAPAVLLLAACSSSSIPAHDLEAVVVVDGVTTRALLSFPERDPEAAHSSGDSSCGLLSGNCGSDAATDGRVQDEGDATRISQASYTTLRTGADGIYDVRIARSAEDEAAYEQLIKGQGVALPDQESIFCRVYESQLGTPQECYYSSRSVRITLSPR